MERLIEINLFQLYDKFDSFFVTNAPMQCLTIVSREYRGRRP